MIRLEASEDGYRLSQLDWRRRCSQIVLHCEDERRQRWGGVSGIKSARNISCYEQLEGPGTTRSQGAKPFRPSGGSRTPCLPGQAVCRAGDTSWKPRSSVGS